MTEEAERMDDSRFDQIARRLAAGATRRRLLFGTSAIAGAALLGLVGGESEARKGNKRGKRRGKKAKANGRRGGNANVNGNGNGNGGNGNGNGDGNGQEQVTICHKPGTPAEHTIVVARPALDAHLGHGDILGACETDLQVCADSAEPTATGVVLEEGQEFCVSAEGEVDLCDDALPECEDIDGTSGPGGTDEFPPEACNDLPCGALIGQIGEGEPFVVGEGGCFVADAAGELLLSVNDNPEGGAADNSGCFDVTVDLTPDDDDG
jgi:hypothetical protein